MLNLLNYDPTEPVLSIMKRYKIPIQAVYYLEMGNIGVSRVVPKIKNPYKPITLYNQDKYFGFIRRVQGHQCRICEKPGNMLKVVKHTPTRFNGFSTPLNLITLCNTCFPEMPPHKLTTSDWCEYLSLFRMTHINRGDL